MNENFVQTTEVQNLLDRASGCDSAGGDPRLKAIVRDLLESAMTIIARHDVSESEFWTSITYLSQGAGEFGLIVPGVGLEHFMDLLLDAKDSELARPAEPPGPSKDRFT